jgi:serine/threonine-protein kinase
VNVRAEVSLRQLFDEIVDLPPALREATIIALNLPEEIRANLCTMVTFDELIQYAPEQRAHVLANLNMTDSDRIRMQHMLATDASVPGLLQATAAEASQRLGDDELSQSLVGTSIGSFRLLAVIGQGGSSVVFRAERSAGDGSQVVALKLLRIGLYSADAQRRFRREQAILAQLTHPNIASLIEGGVSEAGIPYIAMELVEGEPITHAANARALSIEQRLVLFCTLCRTTRSRMRRWSYRDRNLNLLIRTRRLESTGFRNARLVDDDDVATRTHSVVLTPSMPPPNTKIGVADNRCRHLCARHIAQRVA